MGVFVPILRVLFVLLNVYDTFKTLKLPPPSARNNGQPTVRAMSQRKRAMKGSLAVWLVWVCFALYERTADRIVGIFIPFYNEIKAIVMLFLILTRARGAEPIYLHILRPLVKPYTETLDMLLDIAQHFGDVLFIFVAVPVHFLSSFYSRWILRRKQPDYAAEEPSVIPEYPADVPPEVVYGTARSRRRHLQDAHERAKSNTVADAVKQATYPQKMVPEIWYPPASSYDDSPPTAPKGLPTPPAEDQTYPARERASEEWRRYEAFPAAYPLSPLQDKANLPNDFPTRLATLSGIYQQPQQALSADTQQGFRRSLELSRESSNPDSDGNLSDNRHDAAGVQTDDDMSVDGDYEDEEEDDFNVTLQTPARMTRKKNVSNMTTTSIESRSNASTGLSTVDHGSPLRTRTNSENSTAFLPSDEAPAAGRKRPLSTPGEDEAGARPPLKAKISDNGTIRAKATVRARTRPVFGARTKSEAEDSSASGTENRSNAVRDASVAQKKRHDSTSIQKRSPMRRSPLRPGLSNIRPKITGSQLRVLPRKVAVMPRAASGRPVAKTIGKVLTVKPSQSKLSGEPTAGLSGGQAPAALEKP